LLDNDLLDALINIAHFGLFLSVLKSQLQLRGYCS
jgi:hypothetical protein